MTDAPDLVDELRGLLAEMDNGSLGDEQSARLNEIIVENTDARRAYIRHTNLQANLHRYFSGSPTGEKLADTVDLEPSKLEHAESRNAAGEMTESQAMRSLTLLQRASRHPIPPSIAVALAVVAALLFAMAVTPVSRWIAGQDKEQPIELQPAQKTDFVAKLTNRQNDIWPDSHRPSLRDPRIAVGQTLVLAAGFVEVTFDTGATIVLEGPAELKVTSEQRCVLTRGKLVGACPDERSHGFVIDTPNALVEDVGTEFGVEVHANGMTRIMVFDGDVRVDPVGDAADWSSLELTEDESVTIAKDGSLLADDTFEDGFVRRLLPRTVAEIVRISGNVDMIREVPESLAIGKLKTSRAIGFFIERSDVQLATDVPVLHCVGDPCKLASATNETLPAGTAVDSYYFAVRPYAPSRKPGKGSRRKKSRKVTRFTCSVTFGRPVLGVIADGKTIQRTNSSLGYPSTIYPDSAIQSENNDRIWISEDRHTVHFSVSARDRQGDRLRVLVDANNEEQ